MQPYKPEPLPIAALDYAPLVQLLGEANRSLTRYDGLLHGIQNPGILLSPLTTQEAVLSSMIEGTQVTLGEVLEYEAGGDLSTPEKRSDVHEIQNYRRAMRLATLSLGDRGMTLGLIKEMHAVLMDSVRGQERTLGLFRTDQNRIGAAGSTIAQATFVPPDPVLLQEHLEVWERYMTHKDQDPVVQAGIVHAQFELLHPFNDGNGRIGRLLIPLFLHLQDVLVAPTFYLSSYFEAHRDEYIERLGAISREGDWQGWLRFFLLAVAEQAQSNAKKVREIIALHAQTQARVQEITHSRFAAALVDGLFTAPVFSTKTLLDLSGIPAKSLHGLLAKLKSAGVITTLQEGAGRRSAIHALPELINITEGREVFYPAER